MSEIIKSSREPLSDKFHITRGEVQGRIAEEAQKRAAGINSLIKCHDDGVKAMHAFSEAMQVLHARANEHAMLLVQLSDHIDALEARTVTGRMRRLGTRFRDAWQWAVGVVAAAQDRLRR